MTEVSKVAEEVGFFHASVLTLYPEMFPGPLGASLAGKALVEAKWRLDAVQIRDFAEGRHRMVDDTPSGGGAGMVMKPDVIARALDSVADGRRPMLLMSPRGKPLTQKRVRELADGPGAIILCGRFEGVDERVIEARDLEEVSIGDYILSGGEEGRSIPEILTSGNHGAIDKWRHEQAERITRERRPDLWEAYGEGKRK